MTRLLNAKPSHTTKTEMIFQDLHSRIKKPVQHIDDEIHQHLLNLHTVHLDERQVGGEFRPGAHDRLVVGSLDVHRRPGRLEDEPARAGRPR